MHQNKRHKGLLSFIGAAVSSLLLASVLMSSGESEVIECTAQGTSSQLGKTFTLKITIDEYSPEEDRQALIQAFEKDKNPGLHRALGKLKTRGRMQTPGTVGYELKFIRLMPTSAAGTRRIRILTDRPIAIGESMKQTRSMDYSLSFIELELNEDKAKSTGILLPLCELHVDKKTMELNVEVRRNPFNLVNFFYQK
ncbi:MAG: hypothetical protein HXY24_12620 [Rubrivivax sp.]|nr:hypothetical protein [Rubrivivax sp.]